MQLNKANFELFNWSKESKLIIQAQNIIEKQVGYFTELVPHFYRGIIVAASRSGGNCPTQDGEKEDYE